MYAYGAILGRNFEKFENFENFENFLAPGDSGQVTHMYVKIM